MQVRIGLLVLAITTVFTLQSLPAFAGFGSPLIKASVKVQRIYAGSSGPTYVSFLPWLPDCLYPGGGYLTATWDTNDGGPSTAVDWPRANQIMSLVLFAKATDTAVEVRYRLNTGNPTGWNSCTIDAIHLE